MHAVRVLNENWRQLPHFLTARIGLLYFLVLENRCLFLCFFSCHNVLISILIHGKYFLFYSFSAHQHINIINNNNINNNNNNNNTDADADADTEGTTTTTMPLLSVSNATVTELFKGSAKFGRPSLKKGGGWITTSDRGNVIIQKQTYNDGSVVNVVRWTNYMKLDGLNGRILSGLPILRQHDSVYFKTSSTTTRGDRHKAPFMFQFETEEEAEEFEMWWFLKNGSIAAWKEEDAKKKKAGSSNSSSNNNNIVPLQETTNTSSTPVRKRKAGHMLDDPLRKTTKVKNANHSFNLERVNVDENVLSNGRDDDNDDDDNGISDTCVVDTFKAVGVMPAEVNVNGKLRKIVKVKRSILKPIEESLTSTDNSNDEDGIDLKDDDNSQDSNDDGNKDDSSNDSSGEDVIIDEEDAPQSQNWTTAFAPY
jgi:hypothetical protein